MQRGLYGGGHLPAPYVIDRTACKGEQRPIIYRSWLDMSLELFKQFITSDFSLAYLAHFIETLPHLFPYPSAEDLQRYNFLTVMSKTQTGYTFSSLDSVKHYMSNLTLGGYAKIGKDELGNEILLAGAFEAAVPMDLLTPCYAAITGHYPDGTPFGFRKNSRRARNHTKKWESEAILHGFLKSDNGAVSFSIDNQENKNIKSRYACDQGAELYGSNRVGIIKTKSIWAVSCAELDDIVLNRLCDLVRCDSEMSERIRVLWENQKTDLVDEVRLFNEQIGRAEAHIEHLDNLLTNPARPLSKQTEARYIDQLVGAEIALKNILKKQKAQNEKEDPETVIPNFYYILSHLPTDYRKLDSEYQKKMIRKVIKEIKLNIISPHLFLLNIIWENGIATSPDVALIWRGAMPNTNDAWTPEEDNLLRSLYPTASQIELMKAFPRFSWYRIYDRAKLYSTRRALPRQGRALVNIYHRTVTYEDLESVADLVSTPQEKEQVQEITNTLAKSTLRGELTAYWWLASDKISYSDFLNDGSNLDG
ncbi:hypothetical protein KDA_29060 [Dictyobacter alpinus]|uniref:Uncharacterized protein n=1 Tax=Dictyobacter alpinus TaxID=2014873 RepID=A0A402B7Y3_9CHLR|nr:hypothetical protein [Dictyobacter alpinus]GCE27422.1 hypothetical protein KDA_29060 [Dictyobacter alpinus]